MSFLLADVLDSHISSMLSMMVFRSPETFSGGAAGIYQLNNAGQWALLLGCC
jgi:hypothetical protein